MVWKFSSASSRPWLISGWYGRVSGVPGRVLEDVAPQHRWRQRVVVALTDHRHRDGVGVGECAQLGQRLLLGGRLRQLVEAGRHAVGGQRVEDARGKRLVGEFVQRPHADGLEHGGDGVGVGSDVPVGEVRLIVGEHLSPDARGRNR